MSNEVVSFSSIISRDSFQSGTLPDTAKIDLKGYFVAVKNRHDSGDSFPYSLDELVPTVFSRKREAVEALSRDFTQDIDYRLICRKALDDSSVSGYRTITDYFLSPLAFEFMVARKCRDVFGVYHAVFHAVTKQVADTVVCSDLDYLASQISIQQGMLAAMREQRAAMASVVSDVSKVKADIGNIRAALDEVKSTLPSAKTHTTIRNYASIQGARINAALAAKLGRRASKMTVQQGLVINPVPDDLYGTVNAYPNEIVERVFADFVQGGRP